MIASGKSVRIVNGDNGVGSAQSAKRLRVGHRGHHGTRQKAGNASQRRNTSPVRQKRPKAFHLPHRLYTLNSGRRAR